MNWRLSDNNKRNKKLDFNEFPSILWTHLCNCQDNRRLNTSFSVFTAASSSEAKSGCECLPKIPIHLKNQFPDRFSLARFHINSHVHSQLSRNRCKSAKSMIFIAARPRAGAQLCLHRVTHRKHRVTAPKCRKTCRCMLARRERRILLAPMSNRRSKSSENTSHAQHCM